MPGVPDTNTFSFTDVANAVSTKPSNLRSAFNDASAGAFDPLYEGSKNSLYNFRNYDEAIEEP